MTEFKSIVDAGLALKGSICGTIIKVGDVQTAPNGSWKRQDLEIEDKSGSVKLTAWGNDIGNFELGKIYGLVDPRWSVYSESPQVQPSKDGSYKCVGQSENEALKGPQTSVSYGSKSRNIPLLESSIAVTVRANTLLIAQIEKEVTDVLTDLCGTAPRGDKVGMYTRMNFYFLKGMDAKD